MGDAEEIAVIWCNLKACAIMVVSRLCCVPERGVVTVFWGLVSVRTSICRCFSSMFFASARRAAPSRDQRVPRTLSVAIVRREIAEVVV